MAGWKNGARPCVEYGCQCVSASASETQPTKLLAVFVVDTNETELAAAFGS